MSRRRVIPLLAVLVAVSALPAQAQYRSGMPETLTPAPRAMGAPSSSNEAFRAAYAKAGRPRIAVFWNRDLDDRLSTDYDSVLQASHDSSRVAAVAVAPHGGVVGAAEQISAVTTVRAGERAAEVRGARSGLPERTDWPVATAFNGHLQSAGVRLVDRTLAMRALAAAATADERRDVQTVEIKALQDKADLLVEILQTPDEAAPLGVMFRIDVKAIASGEILASVASDGQPPKTGPGRFVAGAGGFVREAPPEPTATDIGQALAGAMMTALSGRLAAP